MKCRDLLTLLLTLLIASRSLMAADVPQTVEELWADFDPRKDALETEVIREFKEDGEKSILLEAKDFVSESGALKSWNDVDQFAICHHFAERGTTATRKPTWTGPAPTLVRLEWE